MINYLLQGIASKVQFGKNGPKIDATDPSVFRFVNAAEDSLVHIEALTPVSGEHVANKDYVDTEVSNLDTELRTYIDNVANVAVGLSFEGGSPLVADDYQNMVAICTASGGVYVENKIYRSTDNGGNYEWVEIPLKDGFRISISTNLVDGFEENRVYMYDTATDTWIDVGTTPVPPLPESMANTFSFRLSHEAFDPNGNSVGYDLFTLPADSVVSSVKIKITEAFNNGAMALISVDNVDILDGSMYDGETLATFEDSRLKDIVNGGMVNLALDDLAPTTGEAIITIEYAKIQSITLEP